MAFIVPLVRKDFRIFPPEKKKKQNGVRERSVSMPTTVRTDERVLKDSLTVTTPKSTTKNPLPSTPKPTVASTSNKNIPRAPRLRLRSERCSILSTAKFPATIEEEAESDGEENGLISSTEVPRKQSKCNQNRSGVPEEFQPEIHQQLSTVKLEATTKLAHQLRSRACSSPATMLSDVVGPGIVGRKCAADELILNPNSKKFTFSRFLRLHKTRH
ncbi:hypothetical protein DdX_06988 [Ditylenchus destructor]|uniref:Uncharacterized protein n=1 Tax=Ditylenchus destructor TaxID=166010 RepID=A0AAD4N779_9BILA|nr:hypothetical protein DdX_06988 [Ditylenchus destructor]